MIIKTNHHYKIKNIIKNKENEKKIKNYQENQYKICETLFNNGQFKTLKESVKYMGYDPEEMENINRLLDFYYYWDNMNYNKVVSYELRPFPYLFKPINNQYYRNIKGFKKLRKYDREFMLTIDLINKAQRYNQQAKYNESILYLYRACELITHQRLFEEYRINSENIEIHRLLENNLDQTIIMGLGNDTKYHYSNLSLKRQFELLFQLDDRIGNFYYLNKADFTDIINIRHSSLLIHGMDRITQLQFEKYDFLVRQLVKKFDKDACKLLKLTQFPKYQTAIES